MRGEARTIHFGPVPDPVNGDAAEATVKQDLTAKPNPEASETASPIIVMYGRLLAGHKHLGAELRHLLTADHDYHGTLRAALSELLRMERDVRRLIDVYDAAGR